MHKVYNYQVTDDQSTAEVGFDLNGEQFDCIPEIDGLTLLDTISNIKEDDPASNVRAVQAFLHVALPGEADYARFESTVRAKGSGVNVERLVGIVTDLIEAYTTFPTSPPAASATG